jgi:phosphocarrier protein
VVDEMEERVAINNHRSYREVVIGNRLGLHARAAAALVKVAQQYDSDVLMEKNGEAADAKSVLSLISLECPLGTKVTIRAQGLDSESAVEAVARLVHDKFGEE